MKIRLCQYNPGSEQLFLRLQSQFPDLNIKLKKCVKKCKKCKHLPFAIVDKQLINSATVDELYAFLLGMITGKTGC